VKNGLEAVKRSHRNYFAEAIRSAFADSLDLDQAMEVGHEQENRWDYLLGHTSSGRVIAVEPHSAKQDEIGTVIRKRQAALDQLKGHLRGGARVSKWLWVASGTVQFVKMEKARLRLDQSGIEFVGSKVLAKHLPAAVSTAAEPAARARRKASK